jgi:hypothetical protein
VAAYKKTSQYDPGAAEQGWRKYAATGGPGRTAPYVATQIPKTAEELAFEKATSPDAFLTDPRYRLDGADALAQLQTDDGAVEAQQRAMDELFGIYDQGGATAQDRARMAGVRRDQEQWLRGQREADLADYAERGMGGSGMEMLSLMGDRQAAANRISQNDLDTESMHEQRALEALMGGSDLAGAMRKSSFDEGSARADLIGSVAKDNADWYREQFDALQERKFESDIKNREIAADAGVAILGHDLEADPF